MTTNIISGLIAQTALQDRKAFQELYLATSAKLFGVCTRILKSDSEAEDALQEIYVRIWQRAASFAQTEHSPMSWLIAIARNYCIDVIRSRKPGTLPFDEAPEIASKDPTPEQSALISSDRRELDGCLGQLEDHYADAIRGAYLEGYSYDELATRHKTPLNTMRTWLRRSLMKLKECLQK